jgi:hypothetical protein
VISKKDVKTLNRNQRSHISSILLLLRWHHHLLQMSRRVLLLQHNHRLQMVSSNPLHDETTHLDNTPPRNRKHLIIGDNWWVNTVLYGDRTRRKKLCNLIRISHMLKTQLKWMFVIDIWLLNILKYGDRTCKNHLRRK